MKWSTAGGRVRLLRWRTPEWAYHDFSAPIRELALPHPDRRRESLDPAIYEAFVGALKAVDRAGLFRRGAERAFLTLNILWDHASPAFIAKGLVRLNSVPTIERHRRETTPEPFIRCVNRAPRRERMRIWLALYEDLYMEWKTAIAEEARALGANEYISKPGSGIQFVDIARELRDRWQALAVDNTPNTIN